MSVMFLKIDNSGYLFCDSADWKVLKNRKFLGSVCEQNIRTKSRPVIQELQPRYVPLNGLVNRKQTDAGACGRVLL